MKFDPSKPILYLITPGASTEATTPRDPEFTQILNQVTAAVAAGIDLIQLREKRMTARVLFELTLRAAEIVDGSATSLLVNDRADVAVGAGADGVHLTTQSIDAETARRTFGADFLIGTSTHSLEEARAARDGGADFIVFGPVFETNSKIQYGSPAGLGKLAQVATELAHFPVIALGGIALENAHACLQSGARGVAGISLFTGTEPLDKIVDELKRREISE